LHPVVVPPGTSWEPTFLVLHQVVHVVGQEQSQWDTKTFIWCLQKYYTIQKNYTWK
jgi:hypothetical protein